MKLYHITRDIDKIDTFEPRVPKYANKHEMKVKRICLSSTLEGAISATIYHWFYRDLIISSQGEVLYKSKQKLKFMPFTEALVYEFNTNNIEKGNILYPFELVNYNVYDVDVTKEHWIINQSITPINSKLIRLKDCNYFTTFRWVFDRLHEFHNVSDLEFSKINDINHYIRRIDNYYNNERLSNDAENTYIELIRQIEARDKKNIITSLFLEKMRFMEDNSLIKKGISKIIEERYFACCED